MPPFTAFFYESDRNGLPMASARGVLQDLLNCSRAEAVKPMPSSEAVEQYQNLKSCIVEAKYEDEDNWREDLLEGQEVAISCLNSARKKLNSARKKLSEVGEPSEDALDADRCEQAVDRWEQRVLFFNHVRELECVASRRTNKYGRVVRGVQLQKQTVMQLDI
jgi:hypothetical protein